MVRRVRAVGVRTEEAQADVADRAGSPRLWDALAVVSGGLLCGGLAFLALNQPWVSDDFSGMLWLKDHPGFWDYVSYWYQTWTGRFSSTAFSWLALQIRPVYGLALWLGMLLLVIMIFAVARGRLPRRSRADLAVVGLLLLLVWYGMPALEETMFWTSGSLVYMWPAVFSLVFLYQYRRWEGDPAATRTHGIAAWPAIIGMLALGVWVGGSHEQVLVACLLYLGIVGLRALAAHRLATIPTRLYAGGFGLALGGAISLVAPGNGARLDAIPSFGPGETALAAVKFLVHMTVEWLPPLWPWLLCLMLLAVPALMRPDGGSTSQAGRSAASWMWAVLGLATISPLLVKPYFGAERTVFFVAVFLATAAVSSSNDGRAEHTIERLSAPVASAVLAFLLLIAAGDVALSGWQARGLSVAQRERDELVAQQTRNGVRDVTVSPLTDETPRRGVMWGDGTADPGFWLNGILASWYEVDSIVITDLEAPGEAP